MNKKPHLRFSKYLSSKKKSIIVFAVFVAVFIAIFFLYNIPIMAVVYPALLCVVIGIVFMIIDYKKEDEKFIGEIEDIINNLNEEIKNIKEIDNKKYHDAIEYYTIWAHQIKTPIAAMKLKIANEDSDFARQMAAQLLSIEQYVEMVLTFLRLDSKSTDYVFKKYKLDDIIRPSIKKFAPIFIEKKIKLEYETIDDEVLTDMKWLAFVIEQLLSNSLKYTKKEGVVKIYLDKKDILCIEDNGIGVALEDLPRIFEKGYTGYNGREEKNSSGIGLFICKRICDGLNIKISASSEVAKGTKIYLDLGRYNLHVE